MIVVELTNEEKWAYEECGDRTERDAADFLYLRLIARQSSAEEAEEISKRLSTALTSARSKIEQARQFEIRAPKKEKANPKVSVL